MRVKMKHKFNQIKCSKSSDDVLRGSQEFSRILENLKDFLSHENPQKDSRCFGTFDSHCYSNQMKGGFSNEI